MTGRDRPDHTTLASDSRGVSALIGFMIMFALLIMLLGLLQAFAVPTWNAETEHDHSQRVQSDLLELQDGILSVAASGDDRSQTVQVGLRYPNRPFLLNPPPSTGTLRTTDSDTVQFENVRANGETGDFWNGTGRTYETRALVYRPAYNEYGNAPTTRLEHGLLVNRFESADRPLTDQRLVQGSSISLVAIDGPYESTRPNSESVPVTAASAPTRRVSVTDDGEPISIRVPTALPVAVWEDRLADQRTDTGGHVQAVNDLSGDAIEIVLEPGVTYDLRLANVALDDDPTTSEAAYVTDVEGTGTSVPQDGSQRLAVEVRDRFNAPVAGTDVVAEVVSGPGSVTTVSATTDEDGRAVFRYTADGGPGTAEVRLRYGAALTAEQQVTYSIDVYSTAGTGGGGGDGGVGTGGASQWSNAQTSQTIAVEDGLWQGIDNARSLELSNPQFTPLTGNRDDFDSQHEYFRLTFAVRKGETTYVVDVTDSTDGLRRSLGGGWSNRRVTVYKRVGDASYSTLGSADLRTNRLEPWYQGTDSIDLLTQQSYDGNHRGINELRQFMQTNEDVEIYVVEVDGRVTLAAR